MSTATPTRTHDDADAGRREAIGLFLGFLGVVMFGGTLPFTKLAVGELSPWFITIGRAAAAGLLALATIALTRAPRPKRVDILPLVVSGAFLIIGFPALMTTALKQVPAIHGAIVIGVLPLATVVAAAILLGERPSRAFWGYAILGALSVVAYALTRGGLAVHVHDLLLLGSVACAASGYAIAGRLSRQMRGWAVISWSLVLLLPVNLPLAVWLAPADPGAVSASAWTGFAYVSVFSMFLGFFAWNAGLAMGGVARVSQTQLLQTFVSLAIAVPLLGERLDAHALFFASAVVVIVFLGRRARVG
ncbi:MAG: DMT family transporter [Rhodobiaceae bacterium]|nr:DMT family transporter [Rhodobiaceae bacterium]MCC0017076.1 DMT family transporter [Rhodobiaceae bacterium]MCC0040845.1 DMT family transporter [Rhodobiaceae bacterium]MCC0053671.1 DMT family transporter [Rhodobiaceae bacterium]